MKENLYRRDLVVRAFFFFFFEISFCAIGTFFGRQAELLSVFFMSEDEKVGSSDSRVASASIATDGPALGYTTTPHRVQSHQKTNRTQQ